MEIRKSNIVCSLAGRDKGSLFFVIECDGNYALLADGKGRKLEKPKRKKLKHLRFVADSDYRVAEKIRNNVVFTDSELRRTLASFMSADTESKGDM